MVLFADKKKTFRPKKQHQKGTKFHELHKYVKTTLKATLGGPGNLRQAVALPAGENLNDWLAVNTVDFFNQINLMYGSILDFCTPDTCPVMNAGAKYEYLWADGVKVKQAIKCSAPQYVDYLIEWVQSQLDNENVFPSDPERPFPKSFVNSVKTIFKRLFRVYAHIYHAHMQKVIELGAEAHLNTCFKHFLFFILEFNLVDKKELAPLEDLIRSLKQ
uniref:Uncharacterized protein n=1 Tax=Palpitomonas bilix TaxID=652834 RepID=A0A7S3CUW0_9EUKA|mmetsp:Transcript_10343/g.27102  ORF Transcript_10343/g.27102 Transcript_10343/m.27102 type:complete len:217 (+) Transcript_10343:123-773(+)